MDTVSNQRVLGYKKATELAKEDLGVISGGVNAGVSHSEQLKATGNDQCPDARYDQVIDW